MAPASSSVAFFTCSSCAAWTSGSSISRAPLCCSPCARSHCSTWLMLYLWGGGGGQQEAAPHSSTPHPHIHPTRDRPELDATAPGARVLPQQQVVEGGAADEEEELAQQLMPHGRGQPIELQGLVEGAQLLQELGQGVGWGG